MISKNILAAFLILCLLVQTRLDAQAAPPRAWSGSEIQKQIDELAVTGSVLYIGAHPDDENTAFLATMANGFGVRTGYLALTRGEGGQNLIGSERGALLGMVRSQELLQARRLDKAEQFFTRAIDFGYSKTSGETLRFWGKEKILSDIVYVIRSFRPDIVVTRFTPERGGHGNHTSSAALALDAFDAAGDPDRFPDQLRYVEPWKPLRIVWNGFRFRPTDPIDLQSGDVTLDLGMYDPLLGVSYTELAGQARSMHKSQGFGASQSRGEYLNVFRNMKGAPAVSGFFDGVDLTWRRIQKSERVQELLDSLKRSYVSHHPSGIVPLLFAARDAMRQLDASPVVVRKIKDVERLIVACTGLWIDAWSDKRSYVKRDTVRVALHVVNRSDIPLTLSEWEVEGVTERTSPQIELARNKQITEIDSTQLPARMDFTQPSWLREPSDSFAYRVDDTRQIGKPEDDPAMIVRALVSSPYGSIIVRRPVRYRLVDPVDGEKFIPIRVVPRVTAEFSDRVVLFPSVGTKDVLVIVTAHADVKDVVVEPVSPPGWEIGPERTHLDHLRSGEQRTVPFDIHRTKEAASGTLSITGRADGESIRYSLAEATYPHLPPLSLLEPATVKLIAADIRMTDGTVGYIMGAGDEVPEGIREMGLDVEMLSDDDLLAADLSRYSAIMAGVRAYNTRPVLRMAERRLLSYMVQGGVFIAQYMTTARRANTSIGPYQMTIGRNRVTDESAEMKILRPAHPAFTFPNMISDEDFKGWVQERGLYFGQTWDERYVPLLSCHDAGEPEQLGSLLFAPVGRGAFFYTGLSLFRQIPAGVPGAYRLLSNLLSYGGHTE